VQLRIADARGRREMHSATVPGIVNLCDADGCTTHAVRGGWWCRQHHPKRCKAKVAKDTFTLPSDHEEGRCRNLTDFPGGRCWRHL
jgi:hypothetical protein